VLNSCKSWGFNTLELRNKKWLEIANEIHILCGRQDLIDSWLVIKGGGQTLVNLNDCVFGSSAELREIKNVIGQPDVLLTQFSYASWVGNPDDAVSHRKEARCKLAEMQRQAEILQPKALIPCASFVWFCHEENYFMNREANRIDAVYDFLHNKCSVNTIVLYPGDCWTVGQAIDSTVALRRYEKDYEAVENAPLLVKAEPVPFEKLCQAQASFSRKVLSKNNRFLIQAIPDSVVLLSDLGIKVRISFRSGITKVTNQAVLPDIIVSSESLQYCYLYGWGGNTLEVNGRYSVVPAGKPKRFFNHFKVGSYNDSGFVFNSRLLLDIAKRKLARLARLPGGVPKQ
jgi:UDP-MurNAc hydroxylase